MSQETPARRRTSGSSSIFGRMPRLTIALSILALIPLLAFVAIVGVARLFHSLDDGSISPLRLIVLFAHLLASIMIVTALCQRGRSPRSSASARRRAI